MNNNEQQCNLLRSELQRVQTEKEILKVHLIEQKLMESPTTEQNFEIKNSFIREIENIDYEKFIRNELEINIDQANKLIK